MNYVDSDIRVVAVFPGGLAKVYDSVFAEGAPRTLLETRQFSNYGAAKNWADDFEDKERRSRLLRRR